MFLRQAGAKREKYGTVGTGVVTVDPTAYRGSSHWRASKRTRFFLDCAFARLSLSRMATRTGARRTIYYTKQLSGPENSYARTHQYLGEWKDNQWEGKGTLEKTNGTRYVGEWKGGLRHGTGTLWQRHEDGSLRKIYAGQWLNDKQHGRGTLNYKSKDVYVGEFQRGVRSGVGICTYADGGVYEGEWTDDKRHGFGVFDYKNGDHFEGHWIQDKKEGQGVHFYYHAEKKAHTKRYDGEWVDDLPKCGAYTEMPPDELAPASSLPDPIPAVGLKDPTGVLASRLNEIRAERAHHRAKRISLEEQFTPEELEALQLAFERTSGTGELTYSQLGEAFSQVGMSPSDVELEDALAQLGRPADASFSFADFAQLADLLSPVEM